MANGIYVATSGAMAQLRNLEVLANNLANARTTGFKADRLTFQEQLAIERDTTRTTYLNPPGGEAGPGLLARSPQVEVDKHFVTTRDDIADVSSGAIRRTDNPLDVAITGNGFLRIETPLGERLTRSGQLVIDGDGALRTNAGHRVLSDSGGPIFLPPDEIPTIEADGSIYTSYGATVRLGIATVDLAAGIEKDPQGFFLPPADGDAPALPQTSVLSGHLEESNASPVRTMMDLIRVQRSFGALQKVITTSGDMDKAANSIIGR
jgi:flagellar basal-body rod protein FlgF